MVIYLWCTVDFCFFSAPSQQKRERTPQVTAPEAAVADLGKIYKPVFRLVFEYIGKVRPIAHNKTCFANNLIVVPANLKLQQQ